MNNKYNIALLPVSQSKLAVEYAQKFSLISHRYLLGASSMPHVTLYQFYANEAELQNIWNNVGQLLEPKSIILSLDGFRSLTYDDSLYWASLMPNNHEGLHSMHAIVAKAINKPVYDNYDPHMTLMNTNNKDCEKIVNDMLKSYKPFQDRFIPALGKCDDMGQFTEVVYKA